MIPVLGIPILTGPDLLDKMLRSVTLPVDHLVIIDNGKVVDEVKTSADKVDIVQMPNNIGVAQAWNLIIKSTPQAPWWLICNFDIEFTPKALADVVSKSDKDSVVTSSKGFAAFTIGSNVIRKVGLFDEGFAPAYHEDTDYEHRLRCAGIKVKKSGIKMVHLDHVTAADKGWNLHEMIKKSEKQYVKKWGGTYRQETRTEAQELGWSIDQWI